MGGFSGGPLLPTGLAARHVKAGPMPPSDSPAVTDLSLADFRNYPDLRLALASRSVVLTGPNGAGKTNLLEAISLLAPGRGLRGAAFEELARQNGPQRWAVAVSLQPEDARIATSWGFDGGDESRKVSINGVAQRSAGALGEYVKLLWLTPAMDRLFAGPASDRRRFLDRLIAVFDGEHPSRIAAFEKLMRDRNLLLEEYAPDGAWLSGLEAHMAEAGAAIAAARLSGVEALQAHIDAQPRASAFPFGILAVQGEFETLIRSMPAVQAEDEYRMILADSRAMDRAAGRTLKGPHRSDFLVIHGPKNMAAAVCSTGEQKALLIGLVLAQAHAVKASAGQAPIMLLDEIAAHLDKARRQGLFEELDRLGAQAWMTGTDAELFSGIGREADRFHVERALVTRQ
jgi:DNA replication and repair protein RecF